MKTLKHIRTICLVIIICTISQFSFSKSFIWTGSTDTCWNKNTNWNPNNNGFPTANDTVSIGSTGNHPSLDTTRSVYRLTMSDNTLNLCGYTLTSSNYFSMSGGTISSGSLITNGERASFSGGTVNVTVSGSVDRVFIAGSTFNFPVILENKGTATTQSNGGSTFNAKFSLTKTSASTGNLSISNSTGNTFNDTVIFINNSTGDFVVSNLGNTYFNGDVYVGTGSNGGIQIGSSSSGTTTLASGKKIKADASGFVSGSLELNYFTQAGSTPQTLTLTNIAVINCYKTVFNANTHLTAPGILLRNTTFNGIDSLTQTGNSTTSSYGGNTFNSSSVFNATGTGYFKCAVNAGDTVNGNITITGKTDLITNTASIFKGNFYVGGGPNFTHLSSFDGTAVFSGSNSQVIEGVGRTINMNKIKIDKSGGSVTLDTTVSLNDTLFLVKKNMVTTSSHLLVMNAGSAVTGASDSSFVNGPVKKIGNSLFIFPTGMDSSYRAVEISAPSSSSDAFTAQYYNTLDTIGFDRDTTITFISYCNYWNLARTTGSSNVYVSLYWGADGCSVGDTSGLKVAGWLTNKWKDLGHGVITGNYTSGKIKTASTVSNYGDFLLAYTVQYDTSYNDTDTVSIPIAWQDTIGGSNNDMGYSVKQTLDGGYIIAGSTESYGGGNKDVYLLKMNSDGDTLWTKTYGGAGNEEAFSVGICADSGFVFAGYTDTYGYGNKDIYIVKVNKTGTKLWNKNYGGTNDDVANCILIMNDSTMILTGYTESSGAGGKDIFAMRIESDGDSIWKYNYGGSADDIGYTILATNDGLIFSGSTESYGAGNEDIYVIKTDSAGITDWTETYGGSGTDIAYGMTTCAKGGFLFAGTTESFGANRNDALVLKIKANGDTVFTHVYGGDQEECFYSIAEITDGSLLLCGYSSSYGNGSNDTWIVRTDNWGDELASRFTKANGDDEARAGIILSSGDAVVTGHSKFSSIASFNLQVIAAQTACAIWRPRQVWTPNMWCAFQGQCDNCPGNSDHMLNNPLPNLAGTIDTPLQDFIDYCRMMKMRTVIIRNASTLMVDDATTGFTDNYDNNIATGEPRREKLSNFINLLKLNGHVDRVLLQLRDKYNDECGINGVINSYTYTEDLMDKVIDFNTLSSNPGKFDGVVVDYEYYNNTYGGAPTNTPRCFIYYGWENMLHVLAYCRTVIGASGLTLGAHYSNNNYDELVNGALWPYPPQISVSKQIQADEIVDPAIDPDEIYFEFEKSDDTNAGVAGGCNDNLWPNFWYNDVTHNDHFDNRIQFFGNLSSPPTVLPILHVNESGGNIRLANYMLGTMGGPPYCNNEKEVYVRQVENDWVKKANDYKNFQIGSGNLTWNVNIGEMSWYMYGDTDPFNPIKFPPRKEDRWPNYWHPNCDGFDLDERLANSSNTGSHSEIENNHSISVTPNPFVNSLTVSLREKSSKSFNLSDVRIYGMLGNDVTNNFSVRKDKSSISLSTYTLSPGIYYCRILFENQVQSFKLVKTRK